MSLEVLFLGQIFRAVQMLNFQWNQPLKSWPTFFQIKVGKKKKEKKRSLFEKCLNVKWNMVMQTIDLFLFSLTALLQCSTLDNNLSLWAAPLFPLSRTVPSSFHQCVGWRSHLLPTSPVKKLVLEFTLAKAWLHVFCVAYLNIHVPVSLLLCFLR